MDSMKILTVPINRVDMNEALEKAASFIETKGCNMIITPNSEIVMIARENQELMNTIEIADMVVPDGIGLVMASKIIKKPLKERVTGIDLMENILKYCNKNKKSIYLLGAKPGIATAAAENIQKKYPDLKVSGTYHGYFKGHHVGMPDHEEELKVIEEINSQKPDVLFVAFGAPKQELWMNYYKDRIDTRLMMGVGGSLDVYSGTIKRAPKIYQKLGLEWFYRLIKEPWRYKRMASLPLFVLEVLKRKER